MNLKTGFYTICLLLGISFLPSCLGGSSADEYIVSTDAEILAFSLSSDSVKALSSVKFSIDQINGLIYNQDSMEYGTEIKDKVIVTYTSAAGFTNVLNITDGDSTWVASGDSLDVSKTLTFRVYAPDGLTLKLYEMKLNIHQVDPDSMQYHPLATGQRFLDADELKAILYNNQYYTLTRTSSGVGLYVSADAVNWSAVALTGLPANTKVNGIQQSAEGFYACDENGNLYYSADLRKWQKQAAEYPVKAVLGYLNPSSTQIEGLTLIVEKEGKLVFSYTKDMQDYLYGYDVPEQFPVSDYSAINQEMMYKQRVTIIGGQTASGILVNASWSTLNGLYWARLTDEYQGLFPKMKGINAFVYAEGIYLINGQLEDGSLNKNVYYSVDGGLVWKLKPEKCNFPADYPGRYGAAAVVDASGVIFYIIGGKSPAVQDNIWEGVLNKTAFK